MKKLLAFLSIIFMVALLAAPVMADGYITLTGGSLGIDASSGTDDDILFDTQALTGVDQTFYSTLESVWNANDPTGTGDGWHLTIVAADFVNAASKTIPASGFDMSLTADEIVKADASSNTMPTTSLTGFQAISTEVTFASAAVDAGMGSYDFDPDFQLNVPAETYAGVYQSAVTITIVTAP